MLKRSKQRDAIMEYLKNTTEHPTADMVYTHIREQFPNISLGTVYRNLSLLSSLGEIKKFSCEDNADHFDYHTHPHYHFVCKKCNAIRDMEIQTVDTLNQMANESTNGQIEEHTIFFYGVCNDCLEKQ